MASIICIYSLHIYMECFLYRPLEKPVENLVLDRLMSQKAFFRSQILRGSQKCSGLSFLLKFLRKMSRGEFLDYILVLGAWCTKFMHSEAGP